MIAVLSAAFALGNRAKFFWASQVKQFSNWKEFTGYCPSEMPAAAAALLCSLCCRPIVLTHTWSQGGGLAPSKSLRISQLDRDDVTAVWSAKANSTLLLVWNHHMTCLSASIIMLLIFSVLAIPKDVSIPLSYLLQDKPRIVEQSGPSVWAAKCKK